MQKVTNIEEYNRASAQAKRRMIRILKWTGIFGLLNAFLFPLFAYYSDSFHRTRPFFQSLIPQRQEIISVVVVAFLPACILALLLFNLEIKRKSIILPVKIIIAMIFYFMLLFSIYQFHF